ncbi:MAG: hypothetical protein A4E27_01368 [Methanobacterium sp. PtaU1.Bin242]|nr:MAG: hypothetical protein A4E27_01368 [Methanobacterium sp. PtaU1.Bin242]
MVILLICPECGFKNRKYAGFCEECGYDLRYLPQNQPTTTRSFTWNLIIILILLTIVLVLLIVVSRLFLSNLTFTS